MSLWQRLVPATFVLTGLLVTGCIRSRMLIDVDTSGKGTILVHMMVNEAMLANFQPDASGTELGFDEEAKIFDRHVLERAGSLLGDGVTLIRGKQIREDFWIGFVAEYAFEDVNKLQLHGTPIGMVDASLLAGGNPTNRTDGWRLEFQHDGPTAVLTIVPTTPPPPDEKPEGGFEDPREKIANEPPLLEDLPPQTRRMFGPMRFAIYVRVKGQIVETNANFRLQDNNSTIVLMDVDFDKMLDDAETFQRAQRVQQDLPKARDLAAKQLPGFRLEDPWKSIFVKFE